MSTAPQGSLIGVRLSVMMFLQFFLWGAWYVTLGPYMGARGFKPTAIGDAYSVAPIAAIVAPFFLGIIADRFFASQIVMGILHILGGLILLAAPSVAAESGAENPNLFIGVLLAHMLCYMPTLGLSNTVAFHAMTDPQKQFPLIRVWGTIGWIVAGIGVGYVLTMMHPYASHLAAGLTLEQFEAARFAMDAKQAVAADVAANVKATLDATNNARSGDGVFFHIAGASGILLGLCSFAMPHTPAPMKGKPFNVGAILGLDSLKLLKDRSFLVFSVCSMLICIPLAAYYAFAGVYAGAVGIENVPFKMTFGQMSEIFFMIVMPLCFARLGVKWMLAVGMLAWVARYALFAGAWGDGTNHVMWMVLGGILLHGICYDFFFVSGQIYTEQRAPKEIRAQAQGFLVLLTQGIGMLIGAQVFGRLVTHYTDATTKAIDWQTVWMIPSAFAALVLFVFVMFFKGGKTAEVSE